MNLPNRLDMLGAAVLAVALGLCLRSVDTRPVLLDADEAAWVFDAYYVDLYLDSHSTTDWREFLPYAQHPPMGGYVVGALLHAIGEPMRSLEPRRYWFEHDVELLLAPREFERGLTSRLKVRQVVAFRWLTACLTWTTVLLSWLVARLLAGPVAGVLAVVILAGHPTFMSLAGVGNVEVLSTTAVLASMAGTLVMVTAARRTTVLVATVVVALSLTVCFGTKISGYAQVASAALMLIARGAPHWHRVVAFGVAVVCAVFLTFLLDPTLYGDPVGITLDRLVARVDRISIQQVLFPAAALEDMPSRLRYSAWTLLFEAPIMFLMLGCTFAPVASPTPWLRGASALLCVLPICLMMTLPLAWFRYIAVLVPVLAVVAGVTIASALARFSRRQLIAAGVVICAIGIGGHVLLRENNRPRDPAELQQQMAHLFALSLAEPSELSHHVVLLEYFDQQGNTRRAAFERDIIRRIRGSVADD